MAEHPRPVSIPDVLIALMALGGAGAMVGIYLDTAWHRTLGRDSFFIFPHTLVYGGCATVALAGALGIAAATRRGPAAFGGPIFSAGRLRLPFGFTLTVMGVLFVMAAAPVDTLWHWMWGKDVLIWSPPHLLLVLGGDVTTLGVLFSVAAQRGRGGLGRPWLWRTAMLVVFVDLVHRSHYVLAHYTMIPVTRTPDLYPFLAALLFPVGLVAAARALGPWGATLAALLFVPVSFAMDLMLRAIDFERYTVTPIVALPALAITLTALLSARHARPLATGAAAGLAFAVAFTLVEAAWMAAVVDKPWPGDRVLAGLPRSLVAGAVSGWAGAVLGGFLRAVGAADGVTAEFGSARRARRLAGAAIGLMLAGLVFTYQPQRYGAPMTAEELRLVAVDAVRPQEAVFWAALLQEDWPAAPRIRVRSEGVIDGIPMPVGPAWCAPTDDRLAADLARLRFRLEVNGAPVDLSHYPVVRVRDRSGAHCAWVGVVSTFQRASENRFLYTIDAPGADGAPDRKVVDVTVVFKDP